MDIDGETEMNLSRREMHVLLYFMNFFWAIKQRTIYARQSTRILSPHVRLNVGLIVLTMGTMNRTIHLARED